MSSLASVWSWRANRSSVLFDFEILHMNLIGDYALFLQTLGVLRSAHNLLVLFFSQLALAVVIHQGYGHRFVVGIVPERDSLSLLLGSGLVDEEKEEEGQRECRSPIHQTGSP